MAERPDNAQKGKYIPTQMTAQGSEGRAKHVRGKNDEKAFVDVFEASRSWPHRFIHKNGKIDNIHMDPAWYEQLGRLISVVSTTTC
jgi:hypothetical protein